MSLKTVLQINAVYEIGSTGRNVHELHQYLISSGIDSYVATSVSKVENENIIKIGNDFDHKVHAFLSRVFGLQTYYSKISTKKLLKKINKINPDVILLHNLHANYINMPLLMKYIIRKKIPTVIVLHDCYFLTAKCVHFTAIGCNKWQIGCNNCPKLKKDIPNLFFDRTKKIWKDRKKWFNEIDDLAVIGVSKWTKKMAELSYLKNAKEITYIYNWIDMSIFNIKDVNQELKERFNGKKIILGVSSFWYKNKLKKFEELSKQINDDYLIVLIGKLSTDFVSNEKIVLVGSVNSVEELSQYYNLATVLYNPSKEETFGKVTAECLACGTPVIVYNSTANPELVGENCGVIIESDDNVYEKIIKISENGKEYYSAYCRRFAEENFEMQEQCGKYLELLKKITE